MCCKKWLKNIYKSIVAGKMRFIKLTTKIINSVIVQIILAIIGLCLLIKFLPNSIEWLGIKSENKDSLMSFIELIIEGIFCILVLKEFKMTRKSFEWQKKEQEEKKDKKIEEKIKYFAWLVMDDFKNSYKEMLDKHKKKELLLILQCNEKILDIYCKDRAERYFLPVSFCKTILTSSIKQLTKQWSEGESIDFFVIYDYFIGWSNRIFTTDVFTPYFIKNLNKYFKSYREIEEIYNKLMQDKTI